MKKLYATATGLVVALLFAWASPAAADENAVPVKTACDSQGSWYVNPDEADVMPEAKNGGFLFEGKDLVHHTIATPLALADVHGGTFVANGDTNKVVFKMETTNPYSTIIENPDGKFWSSRIAVDAPGGQNNPVSVVTDMIGSDTKTGNPKYTNDTKVFSFGVGYYTESGSTLVMSISFHGVTYDLTCKPPTSGSPSTSPSAEPQPCEAYLYYGTTQTLCDRFPGADRDDVTCTQVGFKVKLVDAKNDPWGLDGSGDNIGTVGVGCESKTNKPTPTSASPTRSSSVPVAGVGGDNSNIGAGLPVTGPSVGLIIAVGGLILAGGAALIVASRRRRNQFEA